MKTRNLSGSSYSTSPTPALI